MVASIQILRSITSGNRPASRLYGEPYVNFGDNQFGVFDSSNTPRDLIGVPYFSSALSYIAGATVNYQGKLYQSLASVPAGTFNPAQWSLIQGQSYIDTGDTAARNSQNPSNVRLTTFGANSVVLSYIYGAKIKINGVVYDVPAGGIQKTTNNNTIIINGVGGRSLAANGTYYIFAYWTGSVVDLDFRTTGAGAYSHVSSSTAGNVGVEIMCNNDGSGPNNGYSLVGMIVTNASAQIVDTPATRQLLSWYNRRNKSLKGAAGQYSTTSGGAVELNPAQRLYFLNWLGSDMALGVIGYAGNDTAGGGCFIQQSSDGTILTNPFPYAQISTGTNYTNMSMHHWLDCNAAPLNSNELTLHSSSILGSVAVNGTATFNTYQVGMLTG